MLKSIQKAEKKKRDIVKAAESLFLRQGYGASSMDQIAIEAGLTKQTVYRYFPSKNELLIAVMAELQAADLTPFCFHNGSIVDELIGYGNYLLHFHLQTKALGLYRLMLTEGAKEDLFETFMMGGPQRVLQPLIIFLQQRCQLDDPEFYAKMFANMILAPRNQLLMTRNPKMKKSSQNAHVQKVIKLFSKVIKE